MFIASANTDVNFTNSRRICENIHKEALIICKIDKCDDPAKLIDNTLKNFEPTKGVNRSRSSK